MGYRAITCCYRSCASVNTERVNTRLPVLSVGALTSACDAIESTLGRVIDLLLLAQERFGELVELVKAHAARLAIGIFLRVHETHALLRHR